MEVTLRNIGRVTPLMAIGAELVTVVVPAPDARGRPGKPARIKTAVVMRLAMLRKIFLTAKGCDGQSADSAGLQAVKDQVHELVAIAAVNHLGRLNVKTEGAAKRVAAELAPQLIQAMRDNRTLAEVTR